MQGRRGARAGPGSRVVVQPASLPPTTAYTAIISASVTSPAPSTSRRPRSARDHVGGQRPAGEEQHGDADRHVHQEDPVPAEQPGQHAAEQHADRAAAGHDEAEEAHRLRPLAGLGEQAHDQRQGHRRHRGAAEALDRAADDQQARAGRQAAGDELRVKATTPPRKTPLVAVQVAEPARQQQEAAEGEHVGVDHPGQRGLAEAEVGLDRGQRDVHDVRVEHDHQVAQAEHLQGQPAGSFVVHRVFSSSVGLVPVSPTHERCGPDTTARPNFSALVTGPRPDSSGPPVYAGRRDERGVARPHHPHVGRGPREPALGMRLVDVGARPRHGLDAGDRRHGQRPRHRPRRAHLRPRGLGLRLRLQLPRPGHRGPQRGDPVPRAGAPGRRAGRHSPPSGAATARRGVYDVEVRAGDTRRRHVHRPLDAAAARPGGDR